jgi:superfamily II DNA or RNA helicase
VPNLLTQLVPFEPVNLENTGSVLISSPDQEDFDSCFEFTKVIAEKPIEAELPIISIVDDMALLWPENTSSPVNFPSTFSENQGINISLQNHFSPLEVPSNEFITDYLDGNTLLPVSSQTLPLSILGPTSPSIQISENLLVKISYPQNISGMLYSERYWKSEAVPEYKRERSRKPGKKQNLVRPKSLHEFLGLQFPRPRFIPSFWDLIFVLLQPPLAFGKTDSLLLPHDLYPYQIEGVRFLVSNNHALLADDMGTGKTVMSTVALKILMRMNTVKSALILCPPSVLFEWERHIADWFPEAIVCRVRGSQDVRSLEWKIPANIHLTTYDTLRIDIDNGLLSKDKWNSFDLIIVDEAHHLKNPTSGRSIAIRSLRPKYRWALTGTPIQNKIEDMAALFEFIYPGLLTQYDLYPERMKSKVAPYFLRRRKSEVLKELPPKIRQDIWLDMSEDQRVEYIQTEKEIQNEIRNLGSQVTRQHIFAKMQHLKQICNFPSNKSRSPKLDTLKEQVEEISSSGNKVIVFTQYVEQGIRKLEPSLSSYGTAVIIGGQSDSNRKIEIEKFKNLEDIPVLIASLKSGGEGLNLTVASYVIHFDHWWNPAVMWQAEDRAHRRGQTQNVNIYSYWMNETIDERIYEILKKKGLLIEDMVDGLSEDSIDELLTMEDLYEIVGIKKDAKDRTIFDPKKWQNLSVEQIRQKLFEISPREFEELVERLMHYLGYPNVRVTKRTGDGGIDVISTRITENGVERIAAQCKRYRQIIGVPIAREFLGAIQDDTSIVKGYLVTTSDFSTECITYCLRHNIELISGLKMADYVKRFGLEI